MQMPAAPGSQNDFPVGEDSQRQLPPSMADRTNEVSKDNEEPGGHRAPHLPQDPAPRCPLCPVNSTHSSPGPDVVELWTGGTAAWKPALEGGLGPGHKVEGRDSLPELGTPTFPPPGPGSGDLQTVAVWGAFLPTTLAGLGHTPEPEPALGP
ncbi:A disintegrin and metalloproteinase with thrombospondin motifs 7 [Plecturocebus cupreus]